MKKILSVALLIFGFVNLFAQPPSWQVDENKYEYVMTFVAFINLDGVRLGSTNDQVGAFVGDECRGVTNLVLAPALNQYYAFISVLSNTENENIQFRVYDSTNDKVVRVDKTIPFLINAHYGNLFQAYSIAKPELSNKAEVVNFDFEGLDPMLVSQNDKEIVFRVCQGQDITALKPIFKLSPGAKLFIKTRDQISGQGTIDFTQDVEYQVLSNDQSVLRKFVVKVHEKIYDPNRDIAPVYYKMDAQCGSDGAIRVVYPLVDYRVDLIINGEVIKSKTINNKEVVFDNLDIGNYRVQLNCFEKDININMKE